MNHDDIDVMKLTPEDYLKMQDRCKELERANSELSDTIHKMHESCKRAVKLRKLFDELFDVGRNEVVSDDEIRKRVKNLQNELTQLRKENYRVYDHRNLLADEKKQQAAYILELQEEIAQLRKENCQVYDQCNLLADEKKQQASYILELREELERIRRAANNSIDSSQTALKDADAKIQSANDRAANAKKEAKEAKERAESASERIRYLERKLRDVESLNDSLMKELARRQGCQTEIREHDADIYQLDVLKYAPDHHDYLLNVIYAAMGMCGEAGEVSELIKKYAYHGHTIDTEHLARELGDVLWYVSYMAHLFGYPLGKIMAMNQEKLAKRYPDGKFDAERSRNRKEGDL